MRQPKPWWNKQKKCWYVQLGRRQIRLTERAESKETYRKEAHDRWHKLMAGERPTSGVTVRDLLDRYWVWAEGNLAESTCHRRKPRLRSFYVTVRPRLKAEDLKPYHVEQWVATSHADNSQTTKSDLISTIKAVTKWGTRQGYLDRDPLALMKPPSRKVRQEFVPADLWHKVLDLATDRQFRDFLEVMLRTGMRVQEIRILEAEHVAGEVCYVPTKPKNGRPQIRPVWMDEDARAIVSRLCQTCPQGPIFRNRRGQPWTRNAIRCRFRRFKQKLSMPKLCATTLRHSFAHYRLTQGQDSAVVAKLMGHVDTRMLMTRYGHLEANNRFMRGEANRFSPSDLENESSSDEQTDPDQTE